MTVENERREPAPDESASTVSATTGDERDQRLDRDDDGGIDAGEAAAAPDVESPDSTPTDRRAPETDVPSEEYHGADLDDRDMSDAAADTHDVEAAERDSAAPGELGEVASSGPLLPATELDQIRQRWHELQHGFVDDPRHAVDDAAKLVALAADRVTSMLRDQVTSLEGSFGSRDNGEPDTEELRTLLRRYHQLLDRLLAF